MDATFRDWSGLPGDLLTSIGEPLGLSGRLCFRGVCRSWSAALPAMPSPWLVIPDGLCFVRRERFTVHSLTARTAFRWKLPGQRCIGSSGGWLAFVDVNLRITLLNPLADDDDGTIRLPPLGPIRLERSPYFSHVTPLSPDDGTLRLRTWSEKYSFSSLQQSFVKRVAFAPNPTAQDYAVAVLCRGDHGVAFITAGSGGWRWLDDWPVAAGRSYPEHVDSDDDTELFYVNEDLDVVYHAGRFYYMTLCGQVWSIDASSSPSPAAAAPVKFAKWRPPGPDYRHYVKHLVFAGGDGPAPLHVVWSDMPGFTCDATRARPMRMRVDRYDPAARRWRKARHLGGSAFLIGQRSQSVAVPASTSTWLRPNCVYFTNIAPGTDNSATCSRDYPEELDYVWEFDVAAGSFRQCDRGGLPLCWFKWLDWPKAIWFTPRVESNGRSAHEMALL